MQSGNCEQIHELKTLVISPFFDTIPSHLLFVSSFLYTIHSQSHFYLPLIPISSLLMEKKILFSSLHRKLAFCRSGMGIFLLSVSMIVTPECTDTWLPFDTSQSFRTSCPHLWQQSRSSRHYWALEAQRAWDYTWSGCCQTELQQCVAVRAFPRYVNHTAARWCRSLVYSTFKAIQCIIFQLCFIRSILSLSDCLCLLWKQH